MKNKTLITTTKVNVFIDNLENVNIEEYKEKIYVLSKCILNEINYKRELEVYVWDNTYFKYYDSIEASVFEPFRDDMEIKNILFKAKTKGSITEEEKGILIKKFERNLCFMEFKADYKKFQNYFIHKESNREEIKLIEGEKNIIYVEEVKNGKKILHEDYKLKADYKKY